MATHSSILAWRIAEAEDPDGLQSIGLQRVGHDRRELAHTHTVRLEVRCKPSCIIFLFQDYFHYSRIFSLPCEFQNSLSTSKIEKKNCQDYDLACIESAQNLGRTDTFMTLTLPIHSHGMPHPLLVISFLSSSMDSVQRFILKHLCLSAILNRVFKI